MNKPSLYVLGFLATATIATATAAQDEPDGRTVYDSLCFACHAMGVAGAPKVGDPEAWQARVAKGVDELADTAINGVQGESGFMPPRGGNPNLSDAEIRAAVEYMVGQCKNC